MSYTCVTELESVMYAGDAVRSRVYIVFHKLYKLCEPFMLHFDSPCFCFGFLSRQKDLKSFTVSIATITQSKLYKL